MRRARAAGAKLPRMLNTREIWKLVGGAIGDAALAERLVDDPMYRRWLREDPGNALLVFHLVQAYDGASRESTALRRERLARLILAPE